MYHDIKYFRSFIRPFIASFLRFLSSFSFRSFNWTDALNSQSALDLTAQRQQTFKYLWHILLETRRKVKFLWNVQCAIRCIDAERPKEKNTLAESVVKYFMMTRWGFTCTLFSILKSIKVIIYLYSFDNFLISTSMYNYSNSNFWSI